MCLSRCIIRQPESRKAKEVKMANGPKIFEQKKSPTDEVLRKMIASGKSVPSKASAK
jgi:hypothetical protein